MSRCAGVLLDYFLYIFYDLRAFYSTGRKKKINGLLGITYICLIYIVPIDAEYQGFRRKYMPDEDLFIWTYNNFINKFTNRRLYAFERL